MENPLMRKDFIYRHLQLAGLLTCVFSLCAGSAVAQSAADINNANRASESIQRQQLQRQEEDIQRSLKEKRSPSSLEVETPDVPTGTGEGCLDITEVVIADAENMPEAMVDAIASRHEGTCVDVNDIQSILSDITKFYIDEGYVATRAYLPAQDLSTGVLRIQVVEGRIGKVMLKEGDEGSLNLTTAFPDERGAYLNLRDFEQGLDQVNRLLSNNATLELLPGEKPGESLVVITNEPEKRWHMNLTGDNYGTSNTGREQVGATLGVDNLFGLNDYLSLTRRHSDWPWENSEEQSSATTGLFSVPYHYTTFTAGYTYSDYDSILSTPGSNLALSGNNKAAFATVDHVLYRDQDSKLNGYVTLTRKTANNYIEGQRLSVSSRTLTVLDIGTNYSTVWKGGSVNLGGGYSRGLNWLGALEDADGLPGSAPRAQFSKVTVNAGYYKPFGLYDQNMVFSTQVSGQYAFDTLYGSEQVSIGGIYTVRGFYDEVLANDHGAFWRNDIALMKPFGPVFGKMATLRPYIGLDAGVVGGRAPKTPSGLLVGAAVGLGLTAGDVSFDIYTGHPITLPDSADNEGFNTFARLSFNF